MRWIVSLFGVVALMNASAFGQTWTWNQTTNATWNTGSNWVEGTVPASDATTQLTFNATGTTSYTATNNIGAATFTLNRLTVNNTGTGTVTIAGAAAANTLTFAGTNPTLDITGTTLFTGLMAGSATVTKVGTGTFIHDSDNAGFTGTLIVNAGTFINRATNVATTNFNPVSIVVNNGGTYQFGDNTVGNPNLPNTTYITVNSGGTVIWDEGEDFGGIDLNGGTLNLRAGGYNGQGTRLQEWTSGTVTGGSFAASGTGTSSGINKTTNGVVTISGGASLTGTGPLNILDGTIRMLSAANLGTKPVTLGSATTAGTFEYQGGSASRAGNFDLLGNGTIAVTNPTAILTLSGAFSGSGNLTKSGTGTLTLTGALGQTGTTNVAAGTLRVNPVTASGGFSVADGTVLAVNSGAGTASFTTPTLALGTTASTIRYELTSNSLPTVPLAVVSTSNGLTGGATIILANAQPFALGTYTLLDYSGTAINSGFALSLPGRTAGSLVYNTANTSIDANITSLGDTIKWGGQINGTWDIGTAANVGGTNNWRLVSNNNNTNFIQTDTVTFDDTASGNFTVTIGSNVLPANLTVNNTANDYTFTGAGGIGGFGGLTKTGTGRLTLATNNNYSGTTTLTAGTIQIGSGGTAGSLGDGAVTMAEGTTLAFNRTDASTVVGAIATTGSVTFSQLGTGVATLGGSVTGTGTITKTGTGELVLGADNNGFTGTLIINAGRVTLRDISGGDISATSIVINTGGSFQFGVNAGENPDMPDATYITINTGGEAIFRIGEQFGGINLLGGTLTLNGGSAGGLVGATAMDWRSGTVNGITANGTTGANTITKTTAGNVTVTGLATIGNTLNIQDGTVTFVNAANLGTAVINLGGAATNGTLAYQGATAARAGNMTLNAGGGTVNVSNAASTLTLSGILSDAGGLTKTGAGTLALTAANTYAGGTTISAGRLLVNGQTGANSGTGTGAVTVQSSGTLGGNGRIGGAITVNAGGILSPGTATATPTLTTGSTVTVNGTYQVNFFGTAAADFGALAGQGAVTYGGAGSSVALNLGTVTVADLRNAVGIGNTRNYTIVQSTGAISGAFGNAATSGPIDFTAFGFATSEWTITYGSNQTVISFTPVPEPMTMLAIGLAGTGLIAIRRRRSRNG